MTNTISARIVAHVANGSTLPEAIDAVLGNGTYEKLVGDLYDALTQRTATDEQVLGVITFAAMEG